MRSVCLGRTTTPDHRTVIVAPDCGSCDRHLRARCWSIAQIDAELSRGRGALHVAGRRWRRGADHRQDQMVRVGGVRWPGDCRDRAGLLSAGASIPATVCFAAGAVAGGVSAGGHLVDTARLGTATSATVVLDVAQIVASFASFGAMSITVKAGSAAAALAGSRWFVPLVSTAAGADVVQLVALTDVTFTELNKIQSGAGTPEDKQR